MENAKKKKREGVRLGWGREEGGERDRERWEEGESLEQTAVVILHWILVFAFNLVFFMHCVCSEYPVAGSNSSITSLNVICTFSTLVHLAT